LSVSDRILSGHRTFTAPTTTGDHIFTNVITAAGDHIFANVTTAAGDHIFANVTTTAGDHVFTIAPATTGHCMLTNDRTTICDRAYLSGNLLKLSCRS
jgi:hypothetical protein